MTRPIWCDRAAEWLDKAAPTSSAVPLPNRSRRVAGDAGIAEVHGSTYG